EIDLSRLAAERSSSPDVKRFAQMMVDDHTAAGDKLSGVAVQTSIEAQAVPDDAHPKVHEELAGRQGLDLDKDYIDAMVDDHEKFVNTLESRVDKTTLSKWKDDVKNPVTGTEAKIDVKTQSILPEKSDDPITQRINAWAADTYPAAYAHLQNAKALKDTLKKRWADGRTAAGPAFAGGPPLSEDSEASVSRPAIDVEVVVERGDARLIVLPGTANQGRVGERRRPIRVFLQH